MHGDRVDRPRASERILHGRDWCHHNVVLVGRAVGSLFGEHANDFVVTAVDLHVLAHGARAREQFLYYFLADDGDMPVLGDVFSGERGTFGELVSCGREVGGRGATNEDGSKLVPPYTSETLLALTTGEALLTSGARPGFCSAWASALVNDTVAAVLAVGPKRKPPSPAPRERWFQGSESGLDSFGGAITDGYQHDHGCDPDRHAEDREPERSLFAVIPPQAIRSVSRADHGCTPRAGAARDCATDFSAGGAAAP